MREAERKGVQPCQRREFRSEKKSHSSKASLRVSASIIIQIQHAHQPRWCTVAHGAQTRAHTHTDWNVLCSSTVVDFFFFSFTGVAAAELLRHQWWKCIHSRKDCSWYRAWRHTNMYTHFFMPVGYLGGLFLYSSLPSSVSPHKNLTVSEDALESVSYSLYICKLHMYLLTAMMWWVSSHSNTDTHSSCVISHAGGTIVAKPK